MCLSLTFYLPSYDSFWYIVTPLKTDWSDHATKLIVLKEVYPQLVIISIHPSIHV